ncbi:MAG: PH domain-containing protein [Candidatus Thiodiazotropha sp.]
MKFGSDEKVIHHLQPENRLIIMWAFTKCLTQGLSAGFFFFMLFYFKWIFSMSGKDINVLPEYGDLILFSIIIAIFAFALSYIYHHYLIKTINYYITNKRCIYVGGLLKKVEHSVSYNKITDVERSRNIVEQILGMSTINLFTSGTTSMRAPMRSQPLPELSYIGLVNSEDEAETINEYVRKFGGTERDMGLY